MSEVVDDTRTRRPESEHDRVHVPDRPSLEKGVANSNGNAGGVDKCTRGLPRKRRVGEMEYPRAGDGLEFMVKTETSRQSAPGSGGGGGCSNGGGDGDGSGNGINSGSDGSGGYIAGGGNNTGSVGGALDPMVESAPRQQSVPGGCSGAGGVSNGDGANSGGGGGGGGGSGIGSGDADGGGRGGREGSSNGSGDTGNGGGDIGGNGSGNGSGAFGGGGSGNGGGNDYGDGEGDGGGGGGSGNSSGNGNGNGNGSSNGSGNGGGNRNGDGDGDGGGGGGIRRSVRRRTPSCRTFSSDSIIGSPPPPPATGSARRPSQPRPSVRAPQPSPARARRCPRRMCGDNICGDTTGWEDPCESCDEKPSHAGHLLCSACHGSPLLNSESKTIWRHFTNLPDIERAVRLWEAHLSAAVPPLETIVKPGFRPTTSCLCSRSECLFLTVGRLVIAEQRKLAIRCVACATKKTSLWRNTSSELGLFQRWLSTGESRGKCVRDSGTVLEADSIVCNACWAEFRDKGKSWVKAHGPGFTVKTFLLYLRQGRQPGRDEGHELSVFLTQKAMLGVLETGQAVYLEDGIEMLAKQRADAGLREVTRTTLVSQMLEMFNHLSDTVTDAFFVCFGGDAVGDDNRTRAQFLMPERFDFLYVAKILRGEKRLEGEVSRLRDAVAYSEQALARRL